MLLIPLENNFNIIAYPDIAVKVGNHEGQFISK
jgi:hypothetical protein